MQKLFDLFQYLRKRVHKNFYLRRVFHINLDVRFLIFLHYFKWKVFEIFLNALVIPISTNQTLCIKNCILRIWSQLVFRGISDQTASVGSKSDVRWRDTVSLIVCYDFNSTAFENTDTKTKINNNVRKVMKNVDWNARFVTESVLTVI